MKTFRFRLPGGAFQVWSGDTIGEAVLAFLNVPADARGALVPARLIEEMRWIVAIEEEKSETESNDAEETHEGDDHARSSDARDHP